jgi:hypothetical protein
LVIPLYNKLLSIESSLLYLKASAKCIIIKKEVSDMNNRGLKNRVAFSNAIDKALYEKFELLAQETRIPKSRLLDEAIQLLLKKYNK